MIISGPPSLVRDFLITRFEPFDDGFTKAWIACSVCGSNHFRILCYPKTVESDGSYIDLRRGDRLERDPLHTICAQCGIRKLVLDLDKHGYDGALNHYRNYERGDGIEEPISCPVEKYRVKLVFCYSGDDEERSELAIAAGVQPEDLFDGIDLYLLDDRDEILAILDYLCS